MNTTFIERHFARMGSRFKVSRPTLPSWQRQSFEYSIDILRDNHGEYFSVNVSEAKEAQIDVDVLQVLPKDRHLLLLVRNDKGETQEKDRFLCGHDERDWFVAAVPGHPSTVRDAKEALKPQRVRKEQIVRGVPGSRINRRKNEAFRRQGEWFFVKEPGLQVDPRQILRNEPIRRGGGKPHLVEEVCRAGGETVHVHMQYPNGVTPAEYELLRQNPNTPKKGWRIMQRNAGVYARGTVRHLDHKTIRLHCWHQVLMNTESETRTMRSVAFLD